MALLVVFAFLLGVSANCLRSYDVVSDGGTGAECRDEATGIKTVDLAGCSGYVRANGPPPEACNCKCDCWAGDVNYGDQICTIELDTTAGAR